MSEYTFGTWYPIETAPKDGTHVLGYERGSAIREMWFEVCGIDYGQYWTDDIDSEPDPWCWMPLPPPPSIPQDKEEVK